MNHLWSLPVVGALLGWLTNWLAVWLLFRPRKPVRVFFWTVQGVIPSRRGQLAESVAEAVEERLISGADFETALKNEHVKAAVEESIREYVDSVIGDQLDDLGTLVSAMLSKKRKDILETVPALVTAKIARTLPKLTATLAEKAKAGMDIRAIVVERINQFTDDELETMIRDVVSRELVWIERLGFVIGAVIGALQWLILSLV